MKILITGINGFIGQHLSRKLTEHGHNVIGLENKNGGILNKKLVERAVDRVEVIIHLAALTSHKDVVGNKFETLETNFLGTKNVLDVFSKSKTAKKFIYASTGKVYGNIIRLPITEEHPTSPLNTLGKSKLITEKLIDFYTSTLSNASSKEFLIFRIFNVYGPMQKEDFVIPTILSQLNSDKKEVTLGDIKSKRDYVYIEDVVDAFIRVIDKRVSKRLSIFNICSGKSESAQGIVRIIEKIKGISIKIKSDSNKFREDEEDNEYGSYKKAKKELRWSPKTSLQQGLRKTLDNTKFQVVIFAGGKGTRMQTLYPDTPKLLIPIFKKPFLDYLLRYIKSNGYKDILIGTGHLSEKIESYIKNKKYGVNIEISKEEVPLGTGGAINTIIHKVDNNFFLLFGDVFTKVNFAKMLSFHKKNKALVSAVIHRSTHPEDSDLVEFDTKGHIKKILTKPHKKIPKHSYNLAGMYLISKDIRDFLPKKISYDFEKDLLIKLVDENLPIYAYNTKEFIMDFGTPKRLEKLEKILQK